MANNRSASAHGPAPVSRCGSVHTGDLVLRRGLGFGLSSSLGAAARLLPRPVRRTARTRSPQIRRTVSCGQGVLIMLTYELYFACVMRLPPLLVALNPLPPTPLVWIAMAHTPAQKDEPAARF